MTLSPIVFFLLCIKYSVLLFKTQVYTDLRRFFSFDELDELFLKALFISSVLICVNNLFLSFKSLFVPCIHKLPY